MNIAQSLERAARHHGQRTALIFRERRWSYSELDRRTSALAAGLKGLGLKPGERLALHLPNWPESVLTYYAANKIGVVPIALNVTYKADEIAYILSDGEASAVVTADPVAVNLPQRARMPSVRHMIRAAGTGGAPPPALDGAIGFEDLTAEPGLSALDLDRNETCAILYTSATTGRPKGVMLTHENVVSNTWATNHHLLMTPGDVGLCALPLFHCFGQNFIMNALVNAGATLVLHERFALEEFLAALGAYRVTLLYAVPTMYILLLASDNHDTAVRAGSIGTPIENVEMKVVDPATGREVGDGEPGEIVIKGPNVMKGYFRNPQATAEAVRDGWLHSGDIGYRDPDGYFYIVDRVKDMINVSGFKVFPREVEEVLFLHPAVKEAAVLGRPDPVRGEAVKAFVVLKEGQSADPESLRALCRERIASYKVPEEIEFIGALPKSPTGKILKKDLRVPR